MVDENPTEPVQPTERLEPVRKRSVGEKFRESLAAQIVTGVLAVLIVGGMGFGIGYAVADSGHGNRGHHMMYERDGGGPRERGRERPQRQDRPEQPPTTSTAPSQTPAPGA